MYRGIYTAPPNADEGLQMVFLPDRQVVRVDGWSKQGRLQASDVPLGDFLHGLGITLDDCRQALGVTEASGPQVVGQPVAQPVARAASETTARPVATPSEAPPRAV